MCPWSVSFLTQDLCTRNDVQQIEHMAMPITKYFEMRQSRRNRRCPNTRHCKVCPKPAPNANYCYPQPRMRMMVTSLACVMVHFSSTAALLRLFNNHSFDSRLFPRCPKRTHQTILQHSTGRKTRFYLREVNASRRLTPLRSTTRTRCII